MSDIFVAAIIALGFSAAFFYAETLSRAAGWIYSLNHWKTPYDREFVEGALKGLTLCGSVVAWSTVMLAIVLRNA
jgi:hypothetical protein